ncbi:MAG TPA: hypothetical protein VN929_12370 [Burkholderiales bacterium]|nr:hypothetical protein [Burkholderiales bacterium]
MNNLPDREGAVEKGDAMRSVIEPPGKRCPFVGQETVSVACAGVSSHARCHEGGGVANVHASMQERFAMKRGIRLMALGIAIAVNGVALVAVNVSMVDGAERELLSQQQPERIVITAPRQELPEQQMLVTQNCPGRKAL